MIKKIGMLFLLGICFSNVDSDGSITIQKFGNTIIAYNNYQKHTLFFTQNADTAKTKSVTNIQSETITEKDKPIYLHSELQSEITNLENESFINISEVESDALIVAVIDSGIDLNNNILQPFLYVNPNEIPNNLIDDDTNGFIDDVNGINLVMNDSPPQDDLGHGTLMAGIIAKNGMGNSRLMPIKAFDSQGSSSQFAIATAINYAVAMGANVINCSFGYSYYTEVLRLAIENALDRGIIIVASAGNQGKEQSIYPAAFPGIVAVSALNSSDKLASFSNFGNFISISCIGEDVTSTYLNNQYAKTSGTSISSGYISGIIPYLFKIKNNSNIAQVFSNEAIDLRDPLGNGSNLVGWDKFSGTGKIDLTSFIQPQASSPNISLQITSLLNYPNPVINTNGTEFGYYLNQNASVQAKVYSLFGKELWRTSITSGSTGGISGYNKLSFNCYGKNGMFLPNDTYIVVLYADNGTEKTIARTLFTVSR